MTVMAGCRVACARSPVQHLALVPPGRQRLSVTEKLCSGKKHATRFASTSARAADVLGLQHSALQQEPVDVVLWMSPWETIVCHAPMHVTPRAWAPLVPCGIMPPRVPSFFPANLQMMPLRRAPPSGLQLLVLTPGQLRGLPK